MDVYRHIAFHQLGNKQVMQSSISCYIAKPSPFLQPTATVQLTMLHGGSIG